MLLLLVTRDDKGHSRPFSCQIPQLESAFEVLTSIVATGDVLVSVDLIDHQHGLSLPTEAFDGEPIGPHLEKLEAEWTALLARPVSLQMVYQLLADMATRIQENNQARIDRLELAIHQTERHIQQVQHQVYLEACQVRLELQLTRYLLQLDRAQAGQRRLYERLAPYLDGE